MEETHDLKLDKNHHHHLIPGLPNEIALDCLSRVPYQHHSQLKLVCQGWRNLLSNPSSYLYQYRKTTGSSEDFVCLVQPINTSSTTQTQITSPTDLKDDDKSVSLIRHTPPVYGLTIYNATHGTWHRIPPTPLLPSGIPMFCHCVTLPGKLLLIGGWDPTTLDSVPDVYVYDFLSGGGWTRGAPMSTARSFFACAAIGSSSIYVAGGHDNQKNALRSAEVYDAEANQWRSLPEMAEERDECQGVGCGNGTFWVVSGYGTERQGRFESSAEWFDPVSGSWSRVERVWPFGNSSPRCALGGSGSSGFLRIWFVDCSGVREYDGSEKKWTLMGSIPGNTLGSSSICMAPIGDQIFVMGTRGGEPNSQSHRACLLEKGRWKWTEVETPVSFSAFVYSASSLHL
eukprot:TRINITY_DN12631_c0_g1_i1.p1 TRINITY_DN12631_c0_g1~~TRINITY_DN12631_c0_g1_i1.p1  ORF type:complete len:399 (+),score=28.28 TRINITY_DN12631_c0_g1_i1:431-1627(+)